MTGSWYPYIPLVHYFFRLLSSLCWQCIRIQTPEPTLSLLWPAFSRHSYGSWRYWNWQWHVYTAQRCSRPCIFTNASAAENSSATLPEYPLLGLFLAVTDQNSKLLSSSLLIMSSVSPWTAPSMQQMATIHLAVLRWHNTWASKIFITLHKRFARHSYFLRWSLHAFGLDCFLTLTHQ